MRREKEEKGERKNMKAERWKERRKGKENVWIIQGRAAGGTGSLVSGLEEFRVGGRTCESGGPCNR